MSDSAASRPTKSALELPGEPLAGRVAGRAELVVLPLIAAIALTSVAILDQLIPLAQLAAGTH